MDMQEMRHRTILQRIAHRVMLERGLLPDFSDEVTAEVETLREPAFAEERTARDLRELLWCSIDNDDSLDRPNPKPQTPNPKPQTPCFSQWFDELK